MNKEKIGYYMILLVCLALLGSGISKIVNPAKLAGLTGNDGAALPLAILEFMILAAILIPKTRLLGVILAASYFGGAIAVDWLMGGEVPVPSILLSTILYVGAALYYPALQAGKGAGFAKP